LREKLHAMSEIHLVSTCTERKSAPIANELRLRSVPPTNSNDRIDHWIKRLSCFQGQAIPANTAYAGEHWVEAKKAAELANSFHILSAGYGLISSETPIHPYSATFQNSNPDSVGRSLEEATSWWQRLNEWPGPNGNRTTLRRLSESGKILIAASPAYLRPLEDEISALDPEQVLVISAGSSSHTLPNFVIPAGGRLRLALGGSMVSLNIRLAHHLLGKFGPDLNRALAVDELCSMLSKSAQLPKHDRRRLADSEVLLEIALMRRADPQISASAAHQLMRRSGMACEQGRFRTLFLRYLGEGS
jgi:hypothetical protein